MLPLYPHMSLYIIAYRFLIDFTCLKAEAAGFAWWSPVNLLTKGSTSVYMHATELSAWQAQADCDHRFEVIYIMDGNM